MSASVFIDGEAGTTGLGIRERLADLPDVIVRSIASEARKDPGAKAVMLSQVDVVILCLPDEASRATAAQVASLGPSGPRVIDASSAHRTDPEWVYGFAELFSGQANAIRNARRVSNPGCYATGAIALLRPLVDAGMLPRYLPICINAVSGYSGGGRSMIEAYDEGRAPSFELYGLGLEHKHVPEIVAHSGLTRRPIFVPSVGRFRRGMLVSIPLFLDDLPGRPKAADLEAALAAHYRGSAVVTVAPPHGSRLEAESLNDTDDLEVRVFANETYRHALLVAKLDNLGKGASGAAVQNLRLMIGLS